MQCGNVLEFGDKLFKLAQSPPLRRLEFQIISYDQSKLLRISEKNMQ